MTRRNARRSTAARSLTTTSSRSAARAPSRSRASTVFTAGSCRAGACAWCVTRRSTPPAFLQVCDGFGVAHPLPSRASLLPLVPTLPPYPAPPALNLTAIPDNVRRELADHPDTPTSLKEKAHGINSRGRIMLINTDGEVDGDMTDSDDSQAAAQEEA